MLTLSFCFNIPGYRKKTTTFSVDVNVVVILLLTTGGQYDCEYSSDDQTLRAWFEPAILLLLLHHSSLGQRGEWAIIEGYLKD